MRMRKISRWAEQYGPDNLKQWAMSKSLIETDSFGCPTYVNSDTNVRMLKKYHQDGNSDYYTVISEISDKEADAETIEIEPDGLFSGVEMNILGVDGIDSLKIVGDFLTENEKVRTDSVSIPCSQFSMGYEFAVNLSIDEIATEVSIHIEAEYDFSELKTLISQIKTNTLSQATHRDFARQDVPRVGMPVPIQFKETGTPIVLISIDSLRYDARDYMQPVLSALGENAVVPSEPRTNGHWTPPSHATMFTGVHPGEHKYVGVGDGSQHPIHPDLETIPELLSNNKYKSSGIVSHARIQPKAGFGRGFYRFNSQNMTNWLDRNNDSRTAVNRMIKWITQDRQSNTVSNQLFYFLHVFDPHQAYIPDNPTAALDDINLDAIDTFGSANFEHQVANVQTEGPQLDTDTVEKVKSHYYASVEYTAEQIRRLIMSLKIKDLFKDALIIITGDHGEMFGENGMYKHQSLHYTNIHPFMVVKPPINADWEVPDTPSTIDFLPTIATAAGAEVPSQCQGIAWQEMSQERSERITERIRPNNYSIAVSNDESLAIFTYQEQYPERPRQAEVNMGPIWEEFYQLNESGAEMYQDPEQELSGSAVEALRTQAEEFITTKPNLTRDHQRDVRPSEETDEQLRHLGYK